MLLWASQPLPDPQYNSTNRTPRSTSRRASRQFCAEDGGVRVVHAVYLARGFGLLGKIDGFRAADCIW